MARRSRRRKVLVFTLVILVALLAAGGVSAYAFLTKDDPVVYSNLVEQYKYGSVGTEERQGVPVRDLGRPARGLSRPAAEDSGQGLGEARVHLREGPRDADRHDVPRQADRARRAQLRGLPRGHLPRQAGSAAARRPGHAGQPDEDLGLHRVPAEGRARQAFQRRHDAPRDRASFPRQALVRRSGCSTATPSFRR